MGARSASSHVYVIGAGDSPVKIGVAKDVANRLEGLQVGMPDELRVFHTRVVPLSLEKIIETAVHKALKQHRRRGEWFNVSAAEAADTVERVARDVIAKGCFIPKDWDDIVRQVPAGALHEAAESAIRAYKITRYTPGKAATKRLAQYDAAVEAATGEAGLTLVRWAVLNETGICWIFNDGPDAALLPKAASTFAEALNALTAHHIGRFEAKAA